MVDDGFTTLSTLPEPIASVEHEAPDILQRTTTPDRYRADLVQLRRRGDVVRAVVALLEPADGESGLNYAMRRGGDSGDGGREDYEAGWRVYDPAAATVADPLRTEQGCLCTRNVGAITLRPVQLLWADLPAPSSERFTLLLGEGYPPMDGLTVPAQASALPPESDLLGWAVQQRPPSALGQGAVAPVVQQVVSRSETVSGITATSSGERQELALPADVLFALDSDVVEPGAARALDQAASAVAAVAGGSAVTITGHTDDQGGDAYNQDLSLRRARAVADRVGPVTQAAGITVDVAGKGEGEPLVPGTTQDGTAIPENQARNRRVAFSWTGEAAIAPVAGTSTVAPALAPAVPAPGPAPEGSIASALSTTSYGGLFANQLQDGEAPIRLDVMSARREDGRVRVDLAMEATEVDAAWKALSFRFPANPASADESPVGTSLVDPATGVASFVLADEEERCLCTRALSAGREAVAGQTYHFWAYYPAPPEGVDGVDLQMGSFGRLQDVPLS